ncbi:hypothetical protein BJP44_04095 [Candidatus Williamhamiltonella defendens]|nr:hypothetical protein BJP44_04095 [Candidatus Hamiltonella defensa]
MAAHGTLAVKLCSTPKASGFWQRKKYQPLTGKKKGKRSLILGYVVQDSKGFAAGLMVEQNEKNPSRVDVLWDGVLINQLRIFAVLAQFRLQPSS